MTNLARRNLGFLKIFFFIILILNQSFSVFSEPVNDKEEEQKTFIPHGKIDLSGKFEDNPFNQVVNGQKNTVKITFDNKSELNYTITVISGKLVNPSNQDEIFRNLTAVKYNVLVPPMDHVEVPYSFYSEFQPQELDLIVNVFFTDKDDKAYIGVGYNSTVTIVEPELSIFDPQLIFLYLLLSGMFGGISYTIYKAFFGSRPSKKSKKHHTKDEDTATATGSNITSSTTYDESWIPEHHLKTSQGRTSPRSKKKH